MAEPYQTVIKIFAQTDLRGFDEAEQRLTRFGETFKKSTAGIFLPANIADNIRRVAEASDAASKKVQQGADQAAAAQERHRKSSEQLAGAQRPLSSALGLVAGQLGAIGPLGNLASNVMLQLHDGVTRLTVAGGAAVVGLTALAQSIRA